MSTRLSYDAEALNAACEKLGIKLLVAFGSRVGGRLVPRETSDVDLAVLDDAPYSWRRHAEVYRELQRLFSSPVDLAFLHRADPLFRYEVFRGAARLYGDELEFYEYRAFAYRDYVDSKDLRELEAALMDRKMAHLRQAIHGAS